MSTAFPKPLERLVDAFARLPGVGEKTALRFTMHLLADRQPDMQEMSEALREAMASIRPCDLCGNVASIDDRSAAICNVCRDPRRDATQICVVAKVQDLMAVERSGALRGRYFVLGRLLSPLDGVGPEELPLDVLSRRIDAESVAELVIATPPSVEGEATALHLAREFGARVQVTRIASGIPHGGDLEFADPITLGRAMAGRRGLGA